VVSNALGLFPASLALVLGNAVVSWLRGERGATWAFLVVGATAGASFSVLKDVVQRPRPALWPRLVESDGYAFPSGHAMVTAAVFPLLAHVLARRAPRWAAAFWAMGLLVPLYVGFGRLYLGVHWPTDVLAGWALGALQSGLAVAWLRRRGRASPTGSPG